MRIRELKRKIVTTYSWWNEEWDIPTDMIKAMDEHAVERIAEMSAQGFTSGQLNFETDTFQCLGCWETETITL